MKLLVESGATKSSWIFYNKSEVVSRQTLPGINATSNPDSVTVISSLELPQSSRAIEHVDFYGAGLSNSESIDLVKTSLKAKVDKAKIFCASDLLAACRAVSGDETSVVSILGTGANTAVYDGNKIVYNPRALGYLFEDFGSGYHIGKVLLRKYYRSEMNEIDNQKFYNEYIQGEIDLIRKIYKAAKPNYETAKLSKFLSLCSESLRKETLNEVFQEFFDKQILPIEDAKKYKLNFVGSISEVFQNELKGKAEELGFQIDTISGDPADRLLAYHQVNY